MRPSLALTAVLLAAISAATEPAPFAKASTSAKATADKSEAKAAPFAKASTSAKATADKSGAKAAPVAFTDVTARSGVTFVHNNGAFGKKYLPETIGSGVIIFDLDGDGWSDALFVNSTNWPGRGGSLASGALAKEARTTAALYRNNHNGTFSDVTRGSGVDVVLYGIGGTAGDFDNDGKTDVYLTALSGNRLFRNLGGGKFADVTKAAGVAGGGFSSSALWFDYDTDGRLDLFVANYVDWSIDKDLFCTIDGKNKSYCTPESYKGQSPALYRNRGNGTFEDVTKAAGLLDPTSKGLGVAMFDYDGDGRMDLFVANDTQPNRLFRNRGNGTFVDVAVGAGVAFSEAGVARAGMGVDAVDYDGSGRPSLVIGNFSNEMMALYHNEGTGIFIDEAPRSAIGRTSLLTLTFACFFFDYDLDGRPDIFAANGHVADDIERLQSRVTYAQRPHLFRNAGKGFEALDPQAAGLQQAFVARGAAYADYDNDGDLDLFVTVNRGPARVFRNDSQNANHVLRVQAIGTTSNRDGIGARVELQAAGGSKPWQIVKTGSSYASQSELTLTFGLGSQTSVNSLRVTWPNGKSEVTGPIKADQLVTLKEGAGVLRTAPIRRGSIESKR